MGTDSKSVPIQEEIDAMILFNKLPIKSRRIRYISPGTGNTRD